MTDPTPNVDELADLIAGTSWPNGDRLDGITTKTAGMIAQRIVDAGWTSALTVTDAMLDRAALAMDSTVPNSDGVLWGFTHEDGQVQPVTLRDAARAALTAALQPEEATP